MLLDNYAATLYPSMAITTTEGVKSEIDYKYATLYSTPAEDYSLSSTYQGYFNMFRRGIAFGSGTTPPQKTNYKLENHITSGLTYSGNNTKQSNKVVNWVQTVQNTSTEQITITEVGLFAKYATGLYPTVLLTRTVLDVPVVLQPNDVKTFTITIDYNNFVDGTIVQNA